MTIAAPEVGIGNLTINGMSQRLPGDFVVTEPRKVLVTQLGSGAQVDEIKSWIQKRAGTYANTISSIEVPCKRSSTEARGHAYIIFETVSAAAHTIKLLDASKFKGRHVTARLTTEGLSRTTEDELGGNTGVNRQSLRQDKDEKRHQSSRPGKGAATSISASQPQNHSGCCRCKKVQEADIKLVDGRPAVVADMRRKSC